MKVHLCLLVLSISFVSNIGQESEKYNDNGDGEMYIGNPDDDAIIERPCQVFDLQCIREFFVKHAQCKIANGPIPDPLPRSQHTVYLSRVNISSTLTNGLLTNLNNAKIEEFYINRRTNNLVIAVEFSNFQISARNTYFNFYRRGREPIVAVAPTTIEYTSVTVTGIIPNIADLQLEKAEVTAFVQDLAPPSVIGPGVASNPDPTVVASLVELLADVPTDVQEVMVTEAPYLLPIYIQYNICDSGLKVV